MDAWVEATDAARLELQLEALTIRVNHLGTELGLEREKRHAQAEAARERQIRVARQVADRLRALRSAELKLAAFTRLAEVDGREDGSSTKSADADTADGSTEPSEPQGRNPVVPPLPLTDMSAFGTFSASELSPPRSSNRSSHSATADRSFSTSGESPRSFYLNLSAAASSTFSALHQALSSARSGRRSNRDTDREDVPSARHNPHMGAYDMTHDSDTMMLNKLCHKEGAGVATTSLSIHSTSMATASARRAAAKGAAAAASVRAAREAKAAGPARQLVYTPRDARPDVVKPISLFEAGLSPRRPRSRAPSPAAAFHAGTATVVHESACGFKAFEGTLC